MSNASPEASVEAVDAETRSHVSTGIEELDDQLNGGLPAGSVIACVYPPHSSGQLLNYMLSNRQFFEGNPDEGVPMDLLTTSVPKDRVEFTLEAMDPGDSTRLNGDLDLSKTTVTEYEHGDADSAQDTLDEFLGHYNGRPTETQPSLVIDAINEIADLHSADVWRPFLDDILTVTRAQEGVGYLGIARSDERAWLPYENYILRAVDGVLSYTTEGNTGTIQLTRVRESDGPASGYPIEMAVNVNTRITVDPDQSR